MAQKKACYNTLSSPLDHGSTNGCSGQKRGHFQAAHKTLGLTGPQGFPSPADTLKETVVRDRPCPHQQQQGDAYGLPLLRPVSPCATQDEAALAAMLEAFGSGPDPSLHHLDVQGPHRAVVMEHSQLR